MRIRPALNIAILGITFLLCGCGQPAEVLYSQLTAEPYSKDEVRDGVTYSIKLRQKPFRYYYSARPYTGRVVDYYENDQQKIKCIGRMKEGFPDGNWKYFYETGKMQMTGNFISGDADSIWNKYYDNGSKKVVERYKITNDTIHCDTLGSWYRNGTPAIEYAGDTLRGYYPNGQLAVFSIGKPVTWERRFDKYGVLTSRVLDFEREAYDQKGNIVRKVYFIQSTEGRKKFWDQKYSWSPEQRQDIDKADSVEFDIMRKYDPVIKIYWGH
jgi:antitoxin component YwqK of YwqJK toxin-antitoxin module